MVLGGGGIRGGQIIGASDERGALCGGPHGDHRRSPGHHLQGLGNRLEPGIYAPIGRPLKIANSINDETGKPIEELI